MITMDIYSLAASQIIKQQQAIIGPLALDQAHKVPGLKFSNSDTVEILGDAKGILENLVKQYEQLFGQASIEVCKDAIKEVKPPIPQSELPAILQ